MGLLLATNVCLTDICTASANLPRISLEMPHQLGSLLAAAVNSSFKFFPLPFSYSSTLAWVGTAKIGSAFRKQTDEKGKINKLSHLWMVGDTGEVGDY